MAHQIKVLFEIWSTIHVAHGTMFYIIQHVGPYPHTQKWGSLGRTSMISRPIMKYREYMT